MKRSLLLCFFSVLLCTAYAQVCEPDLTYADSAVGVYPLPEEGVDTACINQYYETIFTAVVPAEVEIPQGTFPLDWIRLDSMRNLPEGLDFSCNPPDCVFPSETLGCVIVSGTPTEANIAPSTYPLVLYVCFSALGLPLCDTIPGELLDAQYIVPVQPEGDCEDITINTKDIKTTDFAVTNSPNPFSHETRILVQSSVTEVVPFNVYDLMGRVVHSEMISLTQGSNTIPFNGSDLSNGMYMYSFGEGERVVTQKMVVSK